MGKYSLIVFLLLAGCAGGTPPVMLDRPVVVLKPTPVPCVDAADRRPPPTALADEAMPKTARDRAVALVSKLKQWSLWGRLANSQLDACTRK